MTDKTLTSEQQSKSELLHLFKDKRPTPEHLLTFRSVGKREFETRVEYDILQNASVKPPKHQNRLLTFTERKSKRKKVSDIAS